MNKGYTLWEAHWALFKEKHGLSEKDMDTGMLVAEGYNNSEIAMKLNVSFETTRSHLKILRKKIGVRNRAEITRSYVEAGLFNPDLKTIYLNEIHSFWILCFFNSFHIEQNQNQE